MSRWQIRLLGDSRVGHESSRVEIRYSILQPGIFTEKGLANWVINVKEMYTQILP